MLTGYVGQIVDCMEPCNDEALLALLAAGISAQLSVAFATFLKLAVRNILLGLLGVQEFSKGLAGKLHIVSVISRTFRPAP